MTSITAVALITAVLGWALIWQAGWAGHSVAAGLLGYALASTAVAVAAARHLRSRVFGLANQVTLLRAGLACLIGGALLAGAQIPGASWSLAGLIALALALDGLDGWLARRLGQVSTFGARFDMEVDALLLLILALLVWLSGQVAVWVLAIGLMRYGFVAAGCVWPSLRGTLPPSRRRKTVCVVQGIALLACLLPPLAPPSTGWMAAGALVALVGSFALDVARLQNRRVRADPALHEDFA